MTMTTHATIPTAARQAMTAHRRTHSHPTDATVKPTRAKITWHAASLTYRCSRCPGLVFHTRTPEELVAARPLRRLTPGAQPFLEGLHTPEERDAQALAWATGDLNRTLQAQLARRNLQQTARRPRPDVQLRKQRATQYLLAEWARCGSQEQAINHLQDLHQRDLVRYEQVMGTTRKFANDTLRGYIQELPPEARADAALAARTSRRR